MKKLIFFVGLFFPIVLFGQSLTGKVANNSSEPLIGANVYWINSNIGVTTEFDGSFEISTKDIDEKILIASYVGYLADTIDVSDQSYVTFILRESQELGEVVVTGQQDGIIISNLNGIKIEQITTAELGKAACCDLAGCFETQASVEPHTTNLLTNSKELRILGLSGVYNQVLVDGFPMIQGLSHTYGISSIPGTLVDNIFVSKGANSVLQGYESISGQVNVIPKDPANTDKFFLNLYMNSFLEKHVNVNFSARKGKWSNLTVFQTVQPANKVDGDDDTFIDLPLLTRYSLFNKTKFGNESEWGWHATLGLRFVNEQRIGGQVLFDAENDQGSNTVYGQTVQINQPEFWSKSGYRFNDNHSFAFLTSGFSQNQQSYFGTVKYDANQKNFYANAQYELAYSNHDLKSGFSFRHLDLKEQVSFTQPDLNRTYAGDYDRSENIPGIFAESTMRFLDDRLTWIAGARLDIHSEFGPKFTPRTLLKYDLSARSTMRANIGKGWRTANLFSENINLLVSSRDIIFEEELMPEEAVNYGINFIQKFGQNNVTGTVSGDFYRTEFKNQIFPDYDTESTKAIIKNFTGNSIGNGFQAELNLRFWERFDLKTGYNYLDVYRKKGEIKEVLPFNAKHKVLVAFSFKPLSKKFHFDLNARWFGEQRLPNTQANPVEFRRPDFSDPYAVVNAQFTYKFEKLELYFGCENLMDIRQEQPIISWQNPFGEYFDTSSVWGQTRGREIYGGLRYYLKHKS